MSVIVGAGQAQTRSWGLNPGLPEDDRDPPTGATTYYHMRSAQAGSWN